MKKASLLTAALFLLAALVAGAAVPPLFPDKITGIDPDYSKNPSPLPDGYKQFKFGMHRTNVLALIRKDPAIKAWDADFIPGFERRNWTVLTAESRPYIPQLFFLFDKYRLYGIILGFNKDNYSYQLILRQLKRKYGQPTSLGQDRTIWQNDKVRMELNPSLYLKYLDLIAFKKISTNFTPAINKSLADKHNPLRDL